MASIIENGDLVEMLSPEDYPVVDHLVTEDDTPVDNVFSEKQQRLLTESLRASWPGPGEGEPYIAMANVGLYFGVHTPCIVPDVMLSTKVSLPGDVQPKNARSYMVWEYSKPPDIVIEVVSNREGGEDTHKLATYAGIPVRYYAIYDPDRVLSDEMLRVYRLKVFSFERMAEPIWFPEVGLGVTLWTGKYEDIEATWLRWVDANGVLVPSGKERADAECQRADAERQRADAERQRAEQLAEQLRQLGVNPRDA